MRTLTVFLVASLLAACAYTPEPSPDSPDYPVPTGSRLILEQPVTVPRGASVILQDGQTTTLWRTDRYRPYCRLELRTRADTPRVIEPDTFTVTRVRRSDELVSAPNGNRLASAALVMVGSRDQGGPMATLMSTELFLASERQPDAYRLTCSHWDEVSFPRHLTISQLRTALEGLFRLEAAPSGD